MSIGTYLRHVRRQNQVGLAEEAALAAIVRSSRSAVIAKTAEGVVTSWNDGATVIYGYTAEQMLGQSIERMFPAEVLDEERARHARVATGVAESGYRCSRVCVDGSAIDVVMSMSPVHDDNGRVVGIASISRPINPQEQTDSRFASLLEAAPDGMLCVDSAGNITMANMQAGNMFGYSCDELLGTPPELLLTEDVRDRYREQSEEFARHVEARQVGGLALTAQRRDGSTFPVEINLATARMGAEAIVIAAIRDVTEQRRTEAATRLSEARLRQLAEHVDTVFILYQLDPQAYLYISPAFHRLTGRTVEALAGSQDLMMDLVHPLDRDRVKRDYLDVFRAGRTASSEHRIIRLDGQIRWVRVFASPVPSPDGTPDRAVIAIDDVTERVQATMALRQAESAARAANDAKSLFLSRMSHELRTPLNAVLGFGQLLERRLDGTDHVPSVRQILKAGWHLLSLIDEVLDIARIESGELSVSLEPVPVDTLIEETALSLQPLADAGKVSLCLSGGPRELHVLADRQRLRQILLNLLSNAIKYNHENGNVWISWASTEDGAAVAIRDNGRGIAPELQDRLFTPFDRLDADTSGVEGSGVGLAVTRALVELMHGSVNFESTLGGGSTFTVTLPSTASVNLEIRTGEIGAVGVPTPTAVAAELVPATMLYVEDNDPNVRVIESLLQLRPGWRLLHAGLGSLGIELARAHHPDLVLLDLHLPDAGGFDVLTTLKKDHATADVPVVILSADASTHLEERLMQAGAAQYLTKPLDIGEVLTLLDDITAMRTTHPRIPHA